MKSKSAISVVVLAALLVAAIPFIMTANTVRAQDGGQDTAALMAKLDQVLAGQREVMDQLAAMKQELNIIKIRITQAQ